MVNEAERVRLAYEKRKEDKPAAVYSWFNKGNQQAYQQRERALLAMLRRAFPPGVGGRRVLDIGCGRGGTLLPMVGYGFDPGSCFGVDILEDRIEDARRRMPSMSFECCSAEESSFERGSFDLVTLFTCLSSVLDGGLRAEICKAAMEMARPGGFVLVYDFVVDNPRNRDVRGVKLGELKELFAGHAFVASKRLTLLPPLARRVGRYSYALCELLSWAPFLRTHRMTMFQKSDER